MSYGVCGMLRDVSSNLYARKNVNGVGVYIVYISSSANYPQHTAMPPETALYPSLQDSYACGMFVNFGPKHTANIPQTSRTFCRRVRSIAVSAD